MDNIATSRRGNNTGKPMRRATPFGVDVFKAPPRPGGGASAGQRQPETSPSASARPRRSDSREYGVPVLFSPKGGEFCSIEARPILTAGMLRCACGSADLISVAPGHDGAVALRPSPITALFADTPDQPATGWCRNCAPWVQRAPQLAEAAD